MAALLIEDYLQTQGLRLPPDEVLAAYLTAQAVMNRGEAAIDRHILWYENDEAVLAEHIEKNDAHESLLKQIFMALDSVCSRTGQQSAVVYALMPSENSDVRLVRLAQQGEVIEQQIAVTEESGWQYLPSRTAQTGWMNIVNDVPQWLALEELKGSRHSCSQSQMSLPVCHAGGAVLGVVYVEHAEKEAFDDAALADWVGLSLALALPLQALLRGEEEEPEHD
ncbi:GAF domain-containing protein [Uruburuella testudinis]|uniref:GAF domain-containing protein n=1 Tax=Uruburuella testudinis TaxID=1282863 RepID=A0ABY4DU31_9NEIS|nr:GAF domain-containing protein [Uruburuella testudinis]UOO82548.1 GAF domain-containing protein [Uruburuella testudinis]